MKIKSNFLFRKCILKVVIMNMIKLLLAEVNHSNTLLYCFTTAVDDRGDKTLAIFGQCTPLFQCYLSTFTTAIATKRRGSIEIKRNVGLK